MKSILYVGATLMIGASIYGFVDYKQTSHKKEFSNMYAEEKEPTVTIDKNVAAPAIEKKGVISPVKKVTEKKQQVSQDEINPVIRPIAEDERMNPEGTKEIENTTVNINTSKESGIEKKIAKKRKFSTKLFSRGALDERYIEPKVKAEKTIETKKAEVKE